MRDSIRTLENKFKNLVNLNLGDPSRINMDSMVDTLLEFYQKEKASWLRHEADADMLLFQYGTYNWDGAGPKFELNVTRQVKHPVEEEFVQFGLTMFFSPADIGELEAFNTWSIDRTNIEDWMHVVKNSAGYGKSLKAEPLGFQADVRFT